MQLLLVEDDLDLTRVMRSYLTESGFSVEVALNARMALEAFASHDFDIVVLDLGLPDQDGLDLLKSIRQEGIQTRVLILSGRTSLQDRLKGFDLGADDYVTKPFALAELMVRLKKLTTKRNTSGVATKLTALDLELDLVQRKVTRAGRTISLTSQEFKTLALLVENAGEVVSRKTILEQVWGSPVDPKTNKLDIRMSRLREKIDVFGENRLIHTVRGVGFVLRS